MHLTTLCYIEKDEQYLMLHRVKKEHDINKDKWIGVGGHFEGNESPEECLLREVKEETGLTLTSYQFRGIITFCTEDNFLEYMFLYTADAFEGTQIKCNEGDLVWVDKKEVFSLNIWPGDRIFLQLLIENYPFFSLKLVYDGSHLEKCYLDGAQMEFFDLLDESGNPTGLVKERNLVHQDGDLHRTVHIWIARYDSDGNPELLLQKRCETKDSFPGCYDISSAGHIMAGDEPMFSALREVYEELGVIALDKDLKYLGMHEGKSESVFYGETFINHEISHVYLYTKTINSFSLQESEVESILWISLDKCIEMVKSNSFNHCLFLDELELLKASL